MVARNALVNAIWLPANRDYNFKVSSYPTHLYSTQIAFPVPRETTLYDILGVTPDASEGQPFVLTSSLLFNEIASKATLRRRTEKK